MKPVTIRLDEDLVDALDEEADDRDVNRTEYVRNILRNRETVRDNTRDNTSEYGAENTREYERTRDNTSDNTSANTSEYATLEERLADLESRVEELEAGGGGAIATTPLATGTPGADVEPSDAVVDALEASGWTEGSTRDTRERNAGVAAWGLAYLREAGEELRRGDFPLDALDDGRDTDFLWLSVIRPAVLAVAAETDAVETSSNDQRYRWVGE